MHTTSVENARQESLEPEIGLSTSEGSDSQRSLRAGSQLLSSWRTGLSGGLTRYWFIRNTIQTS